MNELRVSFAATDDESWLVENDSNRYISADLVKQKIAQQEYIIASSGKERLGYIRLSYFWSFIPFIDMIAVEKEHQRQGVGRTLLRFLEGHAKDQNQTFILSSSQEDEAEPQNWHRHMGFHDAGALINLQPLQSVAEVIFIKHLTNDP